MSLIETSHEFTKRAQEEIIRIEKEFYDREVQANEIEQVFFTYTFGHMKAIMVVAGNTDNRYYEVSYSKNSDLFYIDVYTQVRTIVAPAYREK